VSRPPSGGASGNARAVAAQLLDRIEGDGAFANLVLASADLPERDAGLITELVYGVTRMRRALDHLIDGFVADPPDLATRNLLRVGAYQLHMMGTPAYAAVSETVQAASRRQRGFVNAVLRRVADLEAAWPAEAIRLSYPDWVVERLELDLGADDAHAALEHMNRPPPVTVRLDGYTQDQASQWVAELVGPQPGERVLDMCAGPGGKATAMARSRAAVVAADHRRQRARLVAANAAALGLAALMAARVTGRDRIAVLDTVSPSYLEVLRTYLDAPGLAIDPVPGDDPGISDRTACLIVQQPSFFGTFERLEDLAETAHEAGSLLVVLTDPISLGMFRPPADYGADIVVGEGQTLGIAPTFGGPYVGIFACKQRHIRQMPGRIVGRTVDSEGRTGYVLTLQTREQHIRRERATSNICTSVGLIALMATVYMIAQGSRGLRHIANLCYQKAHYAASAIAGLDGYSLPQSGPFFQEFVVSCRESPGKINRRLMERHNILGGLDVSDRFENGMLLCVTEMNTRADIDSLVGALAEAGQ